MSEVEIIFLQETDSTNSYLKRLSSENKSLKEAIVWADYQSSGRGQRDNLWESEAEKNLNFSILLYPSFLKAKEQFLLSQTISVAIKDILSKYIDHITIKWPNDIYWKEKKICGILIENSLEESNLSKSVIGVGININQEHFTSNAPNPVSLNMITGMTYNREYILHEIKESFFCLYELTKTDRQNIRDRYFDNLYRKEGLYKYSDKDGIFDAKIISVGSEGVLTLETENGEIKKYLFKEVRFL